MFITEIVVSGFLSYGEPTVIKNINSHLNVVVGRNGSGKSNFFAAIRFVLSELPGATRDLLHLGLGPQSSDAFVELCFDNSDGRFVGNSPEVRIRRTITTSTTSGTATEYLFDGRASTKQEVLAQLEAAGFSTTSSPIYIVPQGEVTRVATATDEERLVLLRGVAGIESFESRRDSSLELLEEAKTKLDNSQSHIAHIEARLKDLEAERTDLQEFLAVQTNKRSVEYVLLKKESERIDGLLADLEHQKATADIEYRELVQRLRETEHETETAESRISDKEAEIQMIEAEIDTADQDLKRLGRQSAIPEGDFIAIEPELNDTQADSGGLDAEQLEAMIPGLEEEVGKSQSAVTDAESAIIPLRKKVAEAQLSLKAMVQRKARFASMSEDDRKMAASRATADVEKALELHDDLAETQKDRVAKLEKLLEKSESELAEANGIANSAGAAAAKAVESEKAARGLLEVVEKERSHLQLERRKAEVLIERHKVAAEQSARILAEGSSGPEIANGLTSVLEIARELHLEDKYHGVLAELVEIDPAGAIAVERSAGSALYYHVTEDATTAQLLLEALIERKLDSGTFMPLQELVAPAPVDNSIELLGEDAVPLARYIKPTIEGLQKGIDVVWGRFILTRDLKTASVVGQKLKRLCITPEGDRVDPWGAITGGSLPALSGSDRFEAVRKVLREQRKIFSLQTEAERLARSIDAAHGRVTAAHNSVNAATIERERCNSSNLSSGSTALRLKSEVSQLKSQIEEAKAVGSAQVSAVERLKNELSTINDEYLTPITSEQEAEISELSHYSADLKAQLIDMDSKLESLYEDHRAAELELRGRRTQLTAAKRRAQLRSRLDQEFKEQRARQESHMKRIDQATKHLSQLRDKLLESNEAMTVAQDAAGEARQHRHEAALAISRYERRIEKRGLRQRTLQELRNDNSMRMRAVGQISQAALSGELDSISLEELQTRLSALENQLDGFDSVNKKAADQFETYSRELATLRDRASTIVEDRQSIEKIISELDAAKSLRLTQLLRKVSEHFETIFRELTGSKGSLVCVPNFTEPTGVALKVSLGDDIGMLSGGQKSLCALALILAMQRCEPAPFYIFDEIDANLDTQYRSAVARVIHATARNAQFICTTFRPELVEVADQWYGVSLEQRMTAVEPISKDLALEFVSDPTE